MKTLEEMFPPRLGGETRPRNIMVCPLMLRLPLLIEALKYPTIDYIKYIGDCRKRTL